MDFIYLAAIDVAKRAHKDQRRKYTNEPYIVHPFAVAGLVASVTEDDDMVIAAILHDVVEDSPIEIKTIRGIFGVRIAQMVDDLTDVSRPTDGNRAKRKELDFEHTAKASAEAKTVKLADLIDNTKSIWAFDKNFARKYMHEKRRLLEVLQEGNPFLYALAHEMTQKYFETGEIC